MAALSPPYIYASMNDVKVHSPMRAVDIDQVLSTLPAGADVQLLTDYSREVDSRLAKRRTVPLMVTPHSSIKMYVARSVALVLQQKFGELPASDQKETRDAIALSLSDWVKSVVDPAGFCEVPEDDQVPGAPRPKAQTLQTSQGSPYPQDWRSRSGNRF